MVSVTDDLIARYLAELKARLRTTPERAGQILAEAEDHLRESAAAGEAMGITERGALLGGFFPLIAVVCMLTLALFVIPLLRSVHLPGEARASAPGIPASVIFGGVAVAIGYAIQMARILLRQRDSGAAGERIPHAG